MRLQLEQFKKETDELQKKYGHSECMAVYGAGCVARPKTLFLFMNPTARNITALPEWKGMRVPWAGSKNIWKMFGALGILDQKMFDKIINSSLEIWTEDFINDLYTGLSEKSVYITNLAKCTQADARGLHNRVFEEYLENTLEEILTVNPQTIISFGNQVSSVLLCKHIKVSDYVENESEELIIKERKFPVYPVYYPVGQGMRNIDKAITRIKVIMNVNDWS